MSKQINLLSEIKQRVKPIIVYRWIIGLIRFGFVAKGSIYGTIGLVAVFALVNRDQEILGTHGILVEIAEEPLGRLLIGILMIGLMGYVLRRFIQAVFDPKHPGEFNLKRLIHRCGYLMSGLTYSGIVYTASQLFIGLDAEDDDTIEDFADQLFEHPFGLWLIIIAGIFTVGVGLSYLYGSVSESYISELKSDLNPHLKTWATGLGKVGIAARGISFIIIGILLLEAAFLLRSDFAGGLANALKHLDNLPFGELGLAAIAFGFIAYAIYMLVVALYGRNWI
ncbi:DUF1206 domain-containing protein [Capilliphycus salinus ALCB114379]|uniref:DUF1206 domain-containing protein n=1 Tax=Capilliphycus salinus TaxID=2768948 RepID=UPI0039A4917D